VPTGALVIGIGNDFRGDDAAGLHVVRRLRGALGHPQRVPGTDTQAGFAGGVPDPRKGTELHGVAVREDAGDIGRLIESWAGVELAILVDAVRSGARPGTVFRFDAHAQPIPKVFVSHVSSHGVGLAEAIELAQALDQLPPRLIVYGIEGNVFEAGTGLSSHVDRAVSEAGERILQDLLQ
jgi:hydrogenase maturation protease